MTRRTSGFEERSGGGERVGEGFTGHYAPFLVSYRIAQPLLPTFSLSKIRCRFSAKFPLFLHSATIQHTEVFGKSGLRRAL
jgi:hypothetical protein